MLLGLLFRKNIKQLEDVVLLNLIREDDKLALGEIFERYSFLIVGLCLKYLKDQVRAEDMMMNVFETLPEKIKRNEISNFSSWLYSVAKNECLMELRKKNKKEVDFDKAMLYEIDESDFEFKCANLKDAKLNQLETAIKTLKDGHKVCLTHFYLEQKSYDEVSQLTGYTLNEVKSFIQNGKRNLKIILEQQSEFRA